MKSLLKNIAINSFALFLVAQVLEGIKIEDGFLTIISGGLVLTILSFIVRPILNVLTFPLNVVTLGAASFFVNMFILYLLTLFTPQIKISAFLFTGISFSGFVIPKIYLSQFFAFAVVSFLLSLIVSVLKWLVKS